MAEPPVAPAAGDPHVGQMLDALLAEADGAPITLGDIVRRFGSRSFGMLLMLVLIPAFIPLPLGGGGISGSLASLIGLQLILGLQRPWLPGRLLQRRIEYATLERFNRHIQPLLARLTHFSRPRLAALIHRRPALACTGLQVVVLGVLLALPIPLTNYLFALLILLYAISLIEHDGALLLLAWALGCSAMAVTALASGEALQWLGLR